MGITVDTILCGTGQNSRGVLCNKVGGSGTKAMQERFWQRQNTW